MKKKKGLRTLVIAAAIMALAFVSLAVAEWSVRRGCYIRAGNEDSEYGAAERKIGIITYADVFVDESGGTIWGGALPQYQKGDVFITFSTHSLGWRHGHAGLVVDDAGGVLEAIQIGFNAEIGSAEYWREYPSFAVLRLKNPKEGDIDAIVACALEHINGLPYNLLTGLFFDKNPAPGKLAGTQCSHAVWYPFMQSGYDIDSDGSWLVTPRDIFDSDLFEHIYVRGID